MTMHEFACGDCGNEFEASDESEGLREISNAQQLTDLVNCPNCFGHNVELTEATT